MNILTVQREAQARKIKLYLDNGELKFKAPKGAMDSKLLEQIKRHKTEIIEILASKSRNITQYRAIPLADRTQLLSLSYAQQRLWFIDQLEDVKSQYNMSAALEVKGPLQVAFLQKTLDVIVARHESLRTHFSSGQLPEQIVANPTCCPIESLSLKHLTKGEALAQAKILVDQEAERNFDLSKDLMLRGLLIEIEPQWHILALSMHHIASDGWSVGVLLKELQSYYNTLCQGDNLEPNSLDIQYADYAAWQRATLSEEVLDKSLSAWHKKLKNMPRNHGLALDFPRPEEQSFQGEQHYQYADMALSESFLNLCKAHKATLFMGMTAAFSLFLKVYSGREDIVFGTSVANRDHAQLAPLIGFFVNQLIMRQDLSDVDTFVDLLELSKQNALFAFSNQQLPFDKLVESLNPSRNLSHHPLFQLCLVVQNNDIDELDLDGLDVQLFSGKVTTSAFDLELHVHEEAEGLVFQWRYSTALFKSDTIARLAENFINLLNEVVCKSTQPFKQLQLISHTEQQLVTKEWNPELSDEWDETSIDSMFEQQVVHQPNAVAVEYNGHRLTYYELNEAAEKVADALISAGLAVGGNVAVMMPRNLHLVTTLLGVLKAGGCYVPIDSNYPKQRQEYMLDCTSVDLIIASQSVADNLQLDQRKVLILETLLVDEERTCSRPNKRKKIGHCPAYINFTSGSSGRPKGVVIPHSGVLRLVKNSNYLSFDSSTYCLQNASVSFDAATLEIWAPLLNGGRLIINHEPVFESRSFQRLLENAQINTMWLTSALLSYWVEGLQTDDYVPERVISGGDVVNPDMVKNLRQLRPDMVFVNGYGPTENTTFSCCYRITPDMAIPSPLPIGKPISGTQVFVVNSENELCPIGVMGELCVTGAGLALGYLGNSEFTVEKFVEMKSLNCRVYRTGDIVKWRADGNIEFIGRSDEQVKIRGHRIELKEVESVLRTLDNVKEAVVKVFGEDNDKSCVAFFTVHEQSESNDSDTFVATWKDLYEETYQSTGTESQTFDISGWNSSFTGHEFSAEVMKEWQDATVTRIRNLNPTKILEIGCGTGLLMYQLLPDVEDYFACDFSETVIEKHKKFAQKKEIKHLHLANAEAEQVSVDTFGVEQWAPDVVICNSVAQYFPSEDYFKTVVSRAIDAAQGGKLFFGDLRDHRLVETFYLDIQRFKLGGEVALDDLVRQAQELVNNEQELLLTPQLFVELWRRDPRITKVEVLPKFGEYAIEMNRYRFDAIIYLEQNQEVKPISELVTWHKNLELQELLTTQESTQAFAVKGYPNKRVFQMYSLWMSSQHLTINEYAQVNEEDVLSVEQLHTLANKHEWQLRVELCLDPVVGPGAYNLVFAPANADITVLYVTAPEQLGEQFANRPVLTTKQEPSLLVNIRNALRDQLPEYMLPAHLIQQDKFPITANGKIDRAAIVMPSYLLEDSKYVSPQNNVEWKLANIWQGLLKAHIRIGRQTNFFEAGGHSLLATRMVSKVKVAFQIALSVRDVFSHPTLIALAKVIKQQQYQGNFHDFTIPVVARDELQLASYGQKRLWFIDQLAEQSAQLNMPASMVLTGELDREALSKSLREVVSRHLSLRTNFVSKETLYQKVRLVDDFDLDVLDLSSESADKKWQIAEQRARQEAKQTFNLGNDFLLRAKLLVLEANKHVLLITMHHIASDGWSLGVIGRELSTLYNHYIQGLQSPYEALPIQYIDYAVWQNDLLHGKEYQKLLSYWEQQLADLPPLHSLLTDHPRQIEQNYCCQSLSVFLSETLSDDIRVFCREQNVTLFMFLNAVFAALLHRYTNEHDIVIGTSTANREHEDFSPMIGFFVNQLVMRNDLSGDPTFEELLQESKATAIGAFEHQQMPFEKLVETLNPERDLGHHPLFQILLAVQNNDHGDFALEGLKIESFVDVGYESANDLELHVYEEQTLQLLWHFDDCLFEKCSIERMHQQLVALIQSAIAQAQQPLSQLSHVGRDELVQLEQWSHKSYAFPHQKPLLELFEEQVKTAPSAIAVRDQKTSLSYQALWQRVSQLASGISLQHKMNEAPVGIMLERSTELITSMLACIKIGIAYMPIDTEIGIQRLKQQVEISKCELILVDNIERQAELQSWLPETQVVLIGQLLQSDELPPVDLSGRKIDPISYVLFTSGTTGQPKGVMVFESALVNRILWMQKEYGLTAQDVVLQKTPYTFDVSVWEFFLPLVTGATLQFAKPGEHKNGLYISQLIADCDVTHIHFVPSILKFMLPSIDAAQVASLKHVYFSGEALDPSLIEVMSEKVPQAKLHNLYGPTEATIDVSYWPCGSLAKNRKVYIGKPIDNIGLHVLDKTHQVSGVGVPGELFIAGVGLAAGYINQPQLTAEKFIHITLNDGVPQRMYATGDLVRWSENGELEYLGRLDRQVKINGVRIELAEVEVAILSAQGVERCVVINQNVSNNQQLVAYIVVSESGSYDEQALKEHLLQCLPSYMQPSQIALLDDLPLTSSGKIDTKRLPEVGVKASSSTPLTTDTEKQLAELWHALLHNEIKDKQDNFFALGGHSLLATQLLGNIEEAFDCRISLKQIFLHPELSALASLIERSQFEQTGTLKLERVSRDKPLPASYAQKRLWFLDRLEENQSRYNMFGAYKLCGQVELKKLSFAFEQLLTRHELLRTGFVVENGELYQKIRSPISTNINLLDWRLLDSETRKNELAKLSQYQFDINNGEVLKVDLVQVDDGEYWFALNLHHIASDGWSMTLLFSEVAHYYNTGLTLDILDIQYADYAYWECMVEKSAGFDCHQAYWQSELEGVSDYLQLPSDRARPKSASFSAANATFMLPKARLDSLKKLSRNHDASLFMTLLSVFGVALAKISGQSDFAIAVPSANRDQRALQEIIGFFVNTLPIRFQIEQTMSLVEVLNKCKQSLLGAFDHQALPFDKIIELHNPLRDASFNPLVQVMFDFVANDMQQMDFALNGVLTENITPQFNASKFDISVTAIEQQDGLCFNVEFSDELFEISSIEQYIQYYLALLNGMIEHLDMPLCDFKVTAEDRLSKNIGKLLPIDLNQGVMEILAQKIDTAPEALALSGPHISLTYAQLAESINILTCQMVELGVERQDRVLVGYRDRADYIVAVLSVLSLRACFVPFDSERSDEFNQHVINQVSPKLILTDQALSQSLECSADSRVGSVISAELSHERCGLEYVSNSYPEDVAYIQFTSGSTGRPKGVAVTHGSLLSYCCAARDVYALCLTDRVLQFSNPCFDISVEEIFPTLLSGAACIVYPHAISIKQFSQFIEEQAVSVITLPTAFWHVWVEELSCVTESLNSLRLCIIGGEQVNQTAIERWLSLMPVELLNTYGPTESTVAISYWRACASQLTRPPIGDAFPNASLYVLDEQLQPVPVGAAGILYVAGPQVGNAYWNDAEQTQSVFMTDIEKPDQRMYQTGDIVKQTASGELMFIGRKDEQVKRRGYRIELGAIRDHLLKIQGVQDAVVLSKDVNNTLQIVAYVVIKSSDTDVAKLTTDMLSYMVPDEVHLLDKLPLTKNGKVDRQKLLSMERTILPISRFATKATEKALAEIWQRLLGRDQIGVDDNFFALGGHSLAAVKLESHINKHFNRALSIADIYSQPTIAEQAKLIDRHKIQGSYVVIQHVPLSNSEFPLSDGQQQIWMSQQLGVAGSSYSMSFALQFNGSISIERLQHSFYSLLQRHHILRTAVHETEFGLMQTIRPVSEFAIAITRLQSEQVETEISRFLAREFKLSAPLFDVALLVCADGDDVLVCNIHHSIADGQSLSLFVKELAHNYEGLGIEEFSSIDEQPIQYYDFARWQKEQLQSDVISSQKEYWQHQLANMPAELHLQTGAHLISSEGTSAGFVSISIPTGLLFKVKALSRQFASSEFSLMCSAFLLTLQRYCTQHDLVIGIPATLRHGEQLQSLIGYFVNLMPLRTQIDEGAGIEDWVKSLQQNIAHGLANNLLPLNKILQLARDESQYSQKPTINIVFDVNDAESQDALSFGDSVATMLDVGTQQREAKFDISFFINRKHDQGDIIVEFSASKYEKELIERLTEGYILALETLVNGGHRNIGELLNTISETDPNRAYCVGNKVEFEVEDNSLDCIINNAKTQIICGEHVLTSEQVNVRTSVLAKLLQTHGVCAGHPVLLYVQRSVDFIVAIKAILSLGAYYVPISSDTPVNRVNTIIEDTNTKVAICTADTAKMICDKVNVLFVPNSHNENDFETSFKPSINYDPMSLAYMIYTSGTTGKPKGVKLAWAGVNNLVQHNIALFGLNKNSRILLHSSFSFDASTWIALLALATGADVVICDDHQQKDPELLVQLLNNHQVTHVMLVPSMLKYIPVASISPQVIIVGGETCPPELLKQWQPHCLVFNAYGPTETTVAVTINALQESSAASSIGRPISNCSVEIRDKQARLVPKGICGEAYFKGICVGAGYHNVNDTDAFSLASQSNKTGWENNVYRSGDLMMLQGDGLLYYMGRQDRQITLHGFRIELEEIESCLYKHQNIINATVVLLEQGSAAYMVAFVELIDKDSGSADSLIRAYLQSHLPAYMQPQHIVIVDKFSLTQNDKIDRDKLIADFEFNEDIQSGELACDMELCVADIFSEVLSVEKSNLSAFDNFFALGGDSILATRLLSRVNKQFESSISLVEFFSGPTIRTLSERLSVTVIGVNLLPEMEKVKGIDWFPLSNAQRRMWYLQQMDKNSSAYNVPIAMKVSQRLNSCLLRDALQQVWQSHDILRTRFEYLEGVPQQIVAWPEMDLPYSAIDNIDEQGALEQIREEVSRAFNLSDEPLFKINLYQVGDGSILLINIHHIIIDGWSMGILNQEIFTRYQSLVSQQTMPLLDPERLQYLDYAYWQQERVVPEYFSAQLDYWKDKLAGMSHDNSLSRDLHNVEGLPAKYVDILVDKEISQQVLTYCKKHNITLFMFLSAVYAIEYKAYTHKNDVTFGTDISSRTQLASETMIGFFVNQLVIRSHLDDEMNFNGLLEQLRQEILMAYDHQDVAFDDLVAELSPERDVTSHPLFQVKVVLQNVPYQQQSKENGDMEVSQICLAETQAKLDLLFNFNDGRYGECITGQLEYDANKYSSEHVNKIVTDYVRIIEAVIFEPNKSLAELLDNLDIRALKATRKKRPSLRRRV
ncbi:non-ribosomal peptide synthetase [Pseudoalteromonas prydzensis]|uniref:Amino acid adenylation domain-containing protein n=1 Tax=Pseudoalteromonas prydzensis TaxID=182141 RepID=A0ABR9FP89_9GAMM|nr:non-ribosomal peptide synthetase [Pseudoalteromonas prydzensis]MBE0458636.1 amino acid adenylation domain-containing protein [Pseudoalteromonas prydzensis]